MPDSAPGESPSVLFRSEDASVVLLDIPRSLEEAQVLTGQTPRWRLYSTPPPAEPFALPEPRDASSATLSSHSSPAARVAELMASAAARNALDHLRGHYAGPFCLARCTRPAEDDAAAATCPDDSAETIPHPPGAEVLSGSIREMSQAFRDRAPRFRLILLDPPWPNRSVRRKKKDSYSTVRDLSEMRDLLSAVPVPLHLSDDGLVAVWITNKPSILDLLTAPAGLFAQWGLELVAEWTWLKVTAAGEPLFDLDSAWRKPWERLLIAQRVGSGARHLKLGGRVIVAVPDAHSRKPCLRGQFEDILGEGFPALEVFARSLTAGWWAWGDEVLRLQQCRYWTMT